MKKVSDKTTTAKIIIIIIIIIIVIIDIVIRCHISANKWVP